MNGDEVQSKTDPISDENAGLRGDARPLLHISIYQVRRAMLSEAHEWIKPNRKRMEDAS
jgi:hypothetical protein